ncbi:MAG: hypothetical protein ACE5K4_05900 [Candidatus Hydrothermarchaeota archaeon]
MEVNVLSPDERKVLKKILLLRRIEEYLTKNFPDLALDEKKEKVMELFLSIEALYPELEIQLSCESSLDLHRSYVQLEMYSRIYTDMISPADEKTVESLLKKIKEYTCLPEFKDLGDIIKNLDKISGREVVVEEKEIKVPVKEEIFLLPETKKSLEEFFHNEIIRKEFLLEIDPKIKITLSKIIEEYLDRFIEVSEEAAIKSIEYGHLQGTNKAYNKHIEEKVRSSISWLVRNDIIIEEILERLNKK